MADGIYVGMSAAAARTAQLDAIADNLANAQTPGFKASRPAFQSFLPGRGPSDKIVSAAVATGLDRSAGVMVPTDRALDVVPPADTFMAVATAGGGRAYTRNGKIDVTPDGWMQIDGNQLIDDQGRPIAVPPGSRPTIAETGDIMVEGNVMGRVDAYAINGPLDRVASTLLGPGSGAQVSKVENPTFTVGFLEQGNTHPLEATIQMISAQRNFDSAMQAIQTYRKMDESAVQVGRVR